MPLKINHKEKHWLIISGTMLISSFVTIVLIITVRFGSIPGFVNINYGEQLIVERVYWNDPRNGQNVTCDLTLRNNGFDHVRILGFGSGCTNHPQSDLPFVIKGGERRVLKVSIDLLPGYNDPDNPRIKAKIYTDLPTQSTIPLDYQFVRVRSS